MGIPSRQERQPSLKLKILSAGMAGCIGDAVTFPLDVAKVRLQIQGEGGAAKAVAGEVAKQLKYRGILGTLVTIAREEGPKAMYSGLSPGLQRQMAFSSIRIGMYDTVKTSYFRFFKVDEKNGGQNIILRIAAGITTGGMAVGCAQPTDVVKVRLQASAGVRRYRSSIHAYRTIAAEEGVRGLWKGTLPNIARNSVVNASELVSYDLIKTKILAMQLLSDSMPCHFLSAFGAGLVTTILASPIDVVKTRFMNSEPGVYRGSLHCAMTMFKDNGPLAFYKGVVPSFVRLVSWNIVMFVAFEQLKRAFLKAEDSYNESGSIRSMPHPTPISLNNIMKYPLEFQLQSSNKYLNAILLHTIQYYTDME